MKFLVLLFSDQNPFQEKKAFPAAGGGLKSARERSLEWAEALECEGAQKEIRVLDGKGWTTGRLLKEIASAAKDSGADFVVYSSLAAAFLDLPLSRSLIKDHLEYRAEYTFADGYPAGFAPEIIDSGAAAIMAGLCGGASAKEAEKPVSKDSVFSVIKGDVNSFEIETEIAGEDFRLLRLDFLCDKKESLLRAEALAKKLSDGGARNLLELDREKIGEENVLAICRAARSEPAVLKTVPAFYNVQIEGRVFSENAFSPYTAKEERMPYERFDALMEKASALSGGGFVSLSLFGEAALHPDFDRFAVRALDAGFSVFVEIDGGLLPDFLRGESYARLLNALPALEERKKIYFAVLLDAAEQKTFSLFHRGGLEEAREAVGLLAAGFPECYPQFVRVQENEEELEAFWRFWSDKNSPSGGKIIVQKYDHFCGLLADKKTADLSPLVREPCWHLRRDFDVLLDGSVPLCRDRFLEEPLGNAFDEALSEIWRKKDSALAKHIQKEYKGSCGNCDEYYTFNF